MLLLSILIPIVWGLVLLLVPEFVSDPLAVLVTVPVLFN